MCLCHLGCNGAIPALFSQIKYLDYQHLPRQNLKHLYVGLGSETKLSILDQAVSIQCFRNGYSIPDKNCTNPT